MAKKIVIIGAGIIGASIAYHLAKNGADVTVIEKAVPASGATSKSFAWINASFSHTLDYYQLRMASIAAYRTLEADLQDDGFKVHWHGSLSWELNGEEQSQHIEELTRFGYPLQTIDPKEVASLEPLLNQPDGDCIHCQSEGAINPVAVTEILLQAAAKLGSRNLFGCKVDTIIPGDGYIGIETDLGQIYADTIVVAAGEWAQSLLNTVQVNLPMNNNYGIIVHTRPVTPILSHIILSPNLHFRQEPDGTIIAGETFSGGTVKEDPITIADRILGHLKHCLPTIENLEIDHVMVGKRPVPQDGFPAVGFVEEIEGLYLASMHSGITLAPIIGSLAAGEILNRDKADLLKSFRPARFTGR